MIGNTFSNYTIVGSLGVGGMGEVWRAEDTNLGREVAIKVLPEGLAAEPGRIARLEREARVLASLNHPCIASIYGLEKVNGRQLLIMELVDGEDLSEKIKGGPLDLEETEAIVAQIASGLEYAHQQGIVHRDLKPANVRLTADGKVKILDFGLAKAYSSEPDSEADLDIGETADVPLTRVHTLVGTPRYMSPEQATGNPIVDHRSDIYSLGCIVYEMVAGAPPFAGPSTQSVLAQHATARIPDVREHRSEAPPAVQRLLARALAKIPEDRYSSAVELAADLKRAVARPHGRFSRYRMFAAAVAAVLVVAALVSALLVSQRNARQRTWIHETALPAIDEAVEQGEADTAWALAEQVAAVDPGNPSLAAILDTFSQVATIRSEPVGAEVSRRAFDDEDAAWVRLGLTPLDVRVPNSFQRFRFVKEGYSTAEIVSHWYYLRDQTTQLGKTDEVPEDLMLIPGGTAALNIPGLDHLSEIELGTFLIGRSEVTNREFAAFVQAGGYERPELWAQPFYLGNREIGFEEAMLRLTDSTGMTGPATWEAGSYPDGTDVHPVTGVSWYEADAYARWSGRMLPTLYHWNRAAETRVSHIVVPHSNFDGKGAAPVGSYPGMTAFGVRDMAGNAREWCSNSTSDGQRVILGGGWDDLPYMFNDFFAQDPWDRHPTNGLRTAVYLDHHNPETEAAIDPPFRDFLSEAPVSDEIFAVYRNLFRYDPLPLQAEVVRTDESSADYSVEKVEFAAAYGDERMAAYLYLPKTGSRPYPAVVYFPGSNAIHDDSSDELLKFRFSWLMKNGIAVIFPIYKGTYERGDELDSDYPDESQFYLDHVVMWGKDMSRAIDYLESRAEIDSERLSYFGVSWGGAMGSIMMAVEPRFRTGVLYVAGLLFQKSRPEADAINYVTRVTVPVLMLNGKYDHFFPVKSSQIPMFELLGTPPEHKRRYLYETGHSVPRQELIRETLAWFEKYL